MVMLSDCCEDEEVLTVEKVYSVTVFSVGCSVSVNSVMFSGDSVRVVSASAGFSFSAKAFMGVNKTANKRTATAAADIILKILL